MNPTRPPPKKIRPNRPSTKGKQGTPVLLNQVLQAVGELAHLKGSTAKQIVGLLKNKEKTEEPAYNRRCLAVYVQRALSFAVLHGFLAHSAGRYKLQVKEDTGTVEFYTHASQDAVSSGPAAAQEHQEPQEPQELAVEILQEVVVPDQPTAAEDSTVKPLLKRKRRHRPAKKRKKGKKQQPYD